MSDSSDSVRPYQLFRRVVVAVLGLSVLLVGLAMVVLPGPALVVIPAGLGILAIEFEWARRWLRKLKARYSGLAAQVRDATGSEGQPKMPGSKSTPIGQ